MLAGLLAAAAAAAAEEPAASVSGSVSGADQFWVQERPLSAMVSTDLVGQDRRFAGSLGYGINLSPPPSVGAGGGSPFGQISIHNWHIGLDVLQPSGPGRGNSIAQLAMNYGGQVSQSLALSFGPTLSFGGDSAASLMTGAGGVGGLRRFQNDTGMRDYGLRGSAVYSLTDNWALTGVLGYRRSIGELGVSSSDEHFFSILGMGYRF
jgi:hypothetical protein